MQIVGYETLAGEGPAALRIADDGRVTRDPLEPGDELRYALGERHCAGEERDGVHLACGRESAPYCTEHTSRWPCARCTGNCAMPIEACHEEHAVYLAAFAPSTFKVGVTRTWRLEERLREQGADRAAHLRTAKNGKVARQIEADLAERFPDRVRTPRKIEALPERVDADEWERVLAEFDPLDTYSFSYGFDLASRPVPETLASGTVRGTQGRILLIDRAGTTYAVDFRDLVGHEVSPESASRRLQSSFGTFQ
ncbi:MAG: DUF2797 domain-containing protein [Halanaeroarchaeum sp.]